jgi:hypothetical protein
MKSVESSILTIQKRPNNNGSTNTVMIRKGQADIDLFFKAEGEKKSARIEGKHDDRLSDKLRAALATAAALDRHYVARQLVILYRTTVLEDIRRTCSRRASDDKSTIIEELAHLSQYPGAISAER